MKKINLLSLAGMPDFGLFYEIKKHGINGVNQLHRPEAPLF
jgi:hypothetical protein